ncbi:MAG: patatin-like phospholipase family protein [Aquisalimonadaceae bacterium]
MFDSLRRFGKRLRLGPDSRINLALQGGGSHGAYTWGVLDRLLEYGIRIEGISGASAGALNAAALASGWAHGGADGARETLRNLWSAINRKAHMGPMQSTPLDYLLHGWNRDWTPGFMMLCNLTRMASPYQLNLGGYNPVSEIAAELIDFDAIARSDAIRLFVALTNVHNGKLELRRNHQLNADVLAASACLPLVFQAVNIDGVSYWDGGYTGNPALFPLIFECRAPDVLLIQLTPEIRPEVPTQVSDIVDRASEIAFNANLTRELQMISLLHNQSRSWLGKGSRQFYLHQIDTQDAMANMGKASRINADWPFLCHLRDVGHEHASAWLERHARDLGHRSSVNLQSYA